MASFIGRKAVLKQGIAVIAGVKVTGLTIGATPIDISTNTDEEWRVLLSEIGSKTVDISFSGVEKDLALMKTILTESNTISSFSLEFPPEADGSTTTGAAISGNFMLTNYSSSNDGKESATFDASLISSGIISFTDGT